MKKIYFVFVLNLITAISVSIPLIAMTEKRIKIASKESLKSTFNKNPNVIDIDFLDSLGVLDTFAEKEFLESEIENILDTKFQEIWNNACKYYPTLKYNKMSEKLNDKGYQKFMQEYSEIKPHLLQIIKNSNSVEINNKQALN